MKRKQYMRPLCTVSEMEPLTMMANTTTKVGVNSTHPVENTEGDVNRNSDYDIWSY